MGDGPLMRQVSRGPLDNNGDPASRKLRVVCERCNNGWMSRLQDKAKPVLIPLLTNKRWQLDLESQKTLASWITMFCLVYSQCAPQGCASYEEDFRKFASAQDPFNWWLISIGMYTGNDWRTRIETYSSFVKYGYGSPFQPKTPPRVNTEATTAVIGNLLIHTFFSAEYPVRILREGYPGSTFHQEFNLYQIWPPARTEISPTCRVINDTDATRIARAFAAMDLHGFKRETLIQRTSHKGK